MEFYRKPYFVYCEIYRANIYFCPGFSREEIRDTVKEITGDDRDRDFSHLNGFTLVADGPKTEGIFVWVDSGEYSPKIAAVIAHEALHVTNYILHCTGVGVTLENDEAQAYLLGWITKKLTEFYFFDKQLATKE